MWRNNMQNPVSSRISTGACDEKPEFCVLIDGGAQDEVPGRGSRAGRKDPLRPYARRATSSGSPILTSGRPSSSVPVSPTWSIWANSSGLETVQQTTSS